MLREGFTCWSCLFYVYWGNNENGKVLGNILKGKIIKLKMHLLNVSREILEYVSCICFCVFCNYSL